MSPWSGPTCFLLILASLSSWIPLRAEVLYPVRLPPEWSALLDNLRAQAPLRADFRETRVTKMRKKPVQVEGTLRLRSDGVVSLHYPDTNRTTTVLADPSGIRLRINQGRWRTIPDRAKTRALLQAMAALMTLDLHRLGQTHTIDGEQSDGEWRLILDPRPNQKPGVPGRLVLEGTPQQVSRIELNLEPGQSIEIEIAPVEPHITLTPDECSRFFR